MKCRWKYRVWSAVVAGWCSMGCGWAWAQPEPSVDPLWRLSVIHPDPTPFLGAPEVEYLTLTAFAAGESCVSSQGWSVQWNGQVRMLDSLCLPPGATLLVHRSADSTAFSGHLGPRLGLASWPAMVNGGTVVSVHDPSGKAVDAMAYAESDLGGGGRPLRRIDPEGCGAAINQRLWSPGEDAFRALGEHNPLLQGHTSQAMRDSAVSFERLLHRRPGALLWHLGRTANPVSRFESTMSIGGLPVDLHWPTDSTLEAFWNERLNAPGPNGTLPVILDGVRGCAPGSDPVRIRSMWQRFPASAQVEPVAMLANPNPNDSEFGEESVTLRNLSPWPVDAGAWDWEGGTPWKRWILWPGQERQFSASDVDGWPGLANDGGQLTLSAEGGGTVAHWSWSPCDHDGPEQASSHWPLVRNPGPNGVWRTHGSGAHDPPPKVVGFGCHRDWSGDVVSVDVHLDRPVFWLPKLSWTFTAAHGEFAGRAEAKVDHPHSLRVSWEGERSGDWEWPESVSVAAWPAETGEAEGALPVMEWVVSCPPVPEHAPPCLEVSEMLWDAASNAGEFVEVVNCGDIPLDVRGLQATTSSIPSPADWTEWVDARTSLILMPDSVLAFGPCSKWFTAPFPEAGPSAWSVDPWSSLPNGGGQLTLRLPSSGLENLDVVEWSSEWEGPWWWEPQGWSWTRERGGGPTAWSPSPDKGSPGRARQRLETLDCGGNEPSPVQAVERPESGPGLTWRFPSAGHRLFVRMVDWPEGTLRGWQWLESNDTGGEWMWDGLDGWGQPVEPGGLIWIVRWWGAECSGAKRFKVRVPGYR